MSEKVLAYLSENRDRLLGKLNEFLAIPSVSTDSKYKNDVDQAADFIITYLNEIGFEQVEKQDTGPPIRVLEPGFQHMHAEAVAVVHESRADAGGKGDVVHG